jgi:hypothetical protein
MNARAGKLSLACFVRLRKLITHAVVHGFAAQHGWSFGRPSRIVIARQAIYEADIDLRIIGCPPIERPYGERLSDVTIASGPGRDGYQRTLCLMSLFSVLALPEQLLEIVPEGTLRLHSCRLCSRL